MGIFDFLPCRKPRVPGDKVFDAHCHVFNFEYLVLELGQIILDELRGVYPRVSDADLSRLVPGLSGSGFLDELQGRVANILEILIAGFSSEAANAARLRSVAKRAWKVQDLNLIVLMMDIYYLYAPPLDRNSPYPPSPVPQGVGATRGMSLASAESELARRLSDALSAALGRVESYSARDAAKLMSVAGKALTRAGMEELAKKISRAAEPEAADLPPGMKWTAGFLEQFKAVRALGAPGSGIYPFFALDLRRAGALAFAMDIGQVGPGGPFYGVKLYPRLGCHPENQGFNPLYAHCASNKIPITTHSSQGGFPDWIRTYAEYGRPGNYESVFLANPGIKIDLAHFGDRSSPASDWGDQTARLIAAYEGAYSDLSCYTHQASIDDFKASYMNRPRVMDRTMFGSDFDVMFFTNPNMTLDGYYASFLNSFSAAELGRMASDNPKAFLGV